MRLTAILLITVVVTFVSCLTAAAQITCTSGSACQVNFVPVFASKGGNATVTDSIIQQSGSTVTVNGSLSASTFEIGGTVFDFGSTSTYNAFLGFAGNPGSPPSGYSNLAAGYGALINLTSGQGNTALGVSAMSVNSTGTNNTAVGGGALGDNFSGEDNTAVGDAALVYNSTGSNNTALGFSAGPSSDNGNLSNATAIGAWSNPTESNTLILGGTGSYAVSVGIGTGSPYTDYGLTVTTGGQGGVINGGVVVEATGGNLYLGMTNGTHKFRVDTNGAVYADGGLYSSGADFAESVAIRGELSQYGPGDVLEIDQKASRHVALSSHPYATLVAGIYSTRPGVVASPRHIDDESSRATEVPLAVVGIVPCKVTAENGPISRGDLLVTSSIPGYAMKGTDRRRMIGAVLGKALEPFAQGKGTIEVLVTLQ